MAPEGAGLAHCPLAGSLVIGTRPGASLGFGRWNQRRRSGDAHALPKGYEFLGGGWWSVQSASFCPDGSKESFFSS